MRKRTLMMMIALVASLAMAVTGTLAYLSDTDSDVNVMTLGNVDITQHEMKRKEGIAYNATLEEGDLVPFTDGIKLYPAYPVHGAAGDYTAAPNDDLLKWGPYVHTGTAGNGLWNPEKLVGAVDKFVFVENTGSSPAYFRTLIAFERPEGVKIGEPSQGAHIMINVNGSELYTDTLKDTITVDGVQYDVIEYVYEDPLEPGEWSHPSLLQVVMTHHATNKEMELLGDTYEILVLSQAVQVENLNTLGAAGALDAAFGKVDVDNATKWFSEMEGLPVSTASTAEELADALANEGGSIVLTKDITVTSTLNVPKDKNVVLNLNGNDLSYVVKNGTKAAAIISNNGTMEIAGEGTISFTAENPDLGEIPSYATNTITNTGTLTIGKGVTVTNGSAGGASYAVDNHGIFTLDGGTLIGDRCALRVAKYNQDNVVFVMNDGVVKAQTPAWIQLPGSDSNVAPNISVTINGGTFKSTKDPSSADNDVMYTYSFGNSHANTSITINGGEFLGGTVSIGSGYKGDVPELTINGGTFEYDVMQWLEKEPHKIVFKSNK